MNDEIRKQDAAFWEAWEIHKNLNAAWEADPDDSPENWDRHAHQVKAAFNAMMTTPVRTASALLAKYTATGGAEIAIPGGAENTLRMIGWDLERLAGIEFFGEDFFRPAPSAVMISEGLANV